MITYMRTDSVRIAPEAIEEVRGFIKKNFGPHYLPDTPRIFPTKKAAQDAHEAIRPTSLNHTPEKMKKYLTREQFALYELIWKRFIASQMNPAVYDTVSADIETDQNILMRATGSTMKFKGFLALYEEKEDEEKEGEEAALPPLSAGMALHLIEVSSEQSFTRPPPRFTEASLVKELEKSGIGRPSTYASIMNKIQSRDYTVKENQRLKPTELGCVIAQFLEDNFKQIMNVGFTAEMEDTLELVADNKKEWKQVLKDFWAQFIPTIDIAEKEAFVPKLMTDIDCPRCGEAKLQKIWSKSRYFYGCSRYPDCDYTASNEELTFNKADYAADFDWDQKCPNCGNPMKLRHGRFGPFLGCTNYPSCKGIVNITKLGETPVSTEDAPACPAIGCTGKIVPRKSRFGKIFYSCTTFPDCDVIVNELQQLTEKYVDHPKTAYQKKTAAKGAKKGAGGKGRGKFTPSTALAAVIGEDPVTRGEATKKIWDYIKANHLQDPNDKRQIVPDELLSKVFGSPQAINMFKLASILGQNLS